MKTKQTHFLCMFSKFIWLNSRRTTRNFQGRGGFLRGILEAFFFYIHSILPSSTEKRIHKESRFFDSRCFIMNSCKSTTILEVVNLTMPNLLKSLLPKASTKQTKIDICEQSALPVDLSASIVKSTVAWKEHCLKSLKLLSRISSALKVEMYVKFLGTLSTCWKMFPTPKLARYSIVSSKLFLTAHFFLVIK